MVHEADLSIIKAAMENSLQRQEVDGFLFQYRHFFGSYDYVGSSMRWYPNEIRVVRNNKSIYSFGDAQGFRKGNNGMFFRINPFGFQHLSSHQIIKEIVQ